MDNDSIFQSLVIKKKHIIKQTKSPSYEENTAKYCDPQTPVFLCSAVYLKDCWSATDRACLISMPYIYRA